MMTNSGFKQGMQALKRGFGNYEFDVELYWMMLKDISDSDFLKAIKIVLKTKQDIYPGTNLIATIRTLLLRESYPTAGEAWKEAVEATRNRHEIAVFKTPIVKEVAEQVGTYEIATSTNPEMTRAHFIKFYESALAKARETEVLRIAEQPMPPALERQAVGV